MKLNLSRVIFFIVTHLYTIFGWTYFEKSHIPLILFLWMMKCLSITMGMHRLWTHESYKTTKLVKTILLLTCSSTFEGSVRDWTTNHRMHHKYEETHPEFDPYSIKKGFLWAHLLAHCFNRNKEYNLENERTNLELEKERSDFDNKIISFEHNNYTALALFTGIICPLFIFKLVFPKDSIVSYMYSIVLSIIITYHATWSINSFAHLIGDKPYVTDHTSGDTHILSLVTFGEGYHNYHHAYPKDYRAASTIKSCNISAWLITLMHKLGLVHDMKIVQTPIVRKYPDLKNVKYEIIE